MSENDLKLLIADDDDGDRKQMRRTIKHIYPTALVEEALSIDDAIAASRNNEFDCAIIDYRMPGTNVLDGIKILQKSHPHMPLIMVTGQGDELIASEAFKAGISDYLPKSMITHENLQRIITSVQEKATLQRKVDEQREALTNYAHILSHDLRAPASQIISFHEMINTYVENGDKEKIKAYLRYSKDAAQHIMDLIEALSIYNSIDDQDCIHMAYEAMSDIVIDSIRFQNQAIKERKASVTYEKNLPQVKCNKAQIIQLFRNLISNGIKYNKEAMPCVHIDFEDKGNLWQFSVKDNGIGIPKENADSIFKMFSRLHNNEDYEGSGIGLATCKKIIQHHKGSIWLASKEGRGTTFFFTLPKDIPTQK